MKTKRILIMIIFILLIIFLVSSVKLILYFGTNKMQQDNFERLEEIIDNTGKNNYSDIVENETESEEMSDEQKMNILSGYKTLNERNSDMFGWIKIEGTSVSYPVMYTPDDSEYYLHRNFDKENSEMGVPFIDGRCNKDCGNYIIYGHHMKNGKMFAAVSSYSKEEFYKEHPVIRFDTLDDIGSYSVLAAFYSKVYNTQDENVFRYYEYTDLSDPNIFADYVKQAKAASVYETGTEAEYGQQLITLSTCDYYTENGRFVIVACKNE